MSSHRQKKQLSTLDDVYNLSDHDLRDALKKYGLAPGPITGSTRSIYVKKLASLIEEADDADTGVLISPRLRPANAYANKRAAKIEENRLYPSDTSDEDYEVNEEELDNSSSDHSSDEEFDEDEEEDIINELSDIRLTIRKKENHEPPTTDTALIHDSVDSSPNRISRTILVSVAVLLLGIFALYLFNSSLASSLAPLKSMGVRLIPFLTFVLPIGYLLRKVYSFFRQRSHEQNEKLSCLVDEALELLQSPDNPKGSMPVLHIRDTLLSPAERKTKRMINLWSKAVKLIESDSRVKSEMVTIDGEDFRAWKWIGSRNL